MTVLNGVLTRLGDAHHAHERQKAEKNHGAGDKRRHDHDDKQSEIGPADIDKKLRDQDRRQHEDERRGPEGNLVPDVVQIGPSIRRDPRRSNEIYDDAGRHDGHHTRHARHVFGDDIDKIGKGEAQGDLCQPELSHQRKQAHEDLRARVAKRDAAGKTPGEKSCRIGRRRLLVPQKRVEQQHEEGNGCGVVEKALALDQPGEARWRAYVAEDRDDGHRVGRGDDGAEQQAGDQRHARKGGERDADEGRRRREPPQPPW